MRYRWRGEEIEAEAALGDDALELRRASGSPLAIRYSDIDSAVAQDYRIRLTLFPEGEVELYYLAKRYEGFCEELFEKRNAALVRELFLADRVRIATFEGRFERPGAPAAEGRIDLFPRSLVFFPRWADPFFLRIAEVDGLRPDLENYRVELAGEEPLVVSFLGLRFEEFQERVARTREAMERRCAKMLEALVPGAGVLAPWMLDGRVISSAAAGAFWEKLEAQVTTTDERRAAHAHLKAVATAPLWLGVKETGGDDLDELKDDAPPATQHLLWTYAPVRDLSVHEVVSAEDHATYVYRAPVARINRAWAMVQFRRDVLIHPEKYPAAYRRLPRLREVAGALKGRAIHNETWARQLDQLLRF
jgi:hypothetical protein